MKGNNELIRTLERGNPHHKGAGPGGGQFTSGSGSTAFGPMWNEDGTEIVNPTSNEGVGRLYSKNHKLVGQQRIVRSNSSMNGERVLVVGYNDRTQYPYLIRRIGKINTGDLITLRKGELQKGEPIK